MIIASAFRCSEKSRAIWQLSSISEKSEKGSQGCVRAKFQLNSGPSTPSIAAIQFLCDGTTLSGVDFELIGPGYRISLIKKRVITGQEEVSANCYSLIVHEIGSFRMLLKFFESYECRQMWLSSLLTSIAPLHNAL